MVEWWNGTREAVIKNPPSLRLLERPESLFLAVLCNPHLLSHQAVTQSLRFSLTLDGQQRTPPPPPPPPRLGIHSPRSCSGSQSP